jgi:hypothetical protein
MVDIKVAMHVVAPRARVFDVFSDLTQAQARVAGIKRLELLTSGPIAKGTRWRETRVMFGREATEEMVISDYAAPSFYEAAAESHGSKYCSRFDFVPDGDGTQVTMTFRSTPRSVPAKIMTAVLGGAMKKSFEKLMRKDMEDLKAVAETGSQD